MRKFFKKRRERKLRERLIKQFESPVYSELLYKYITQAPDWREAWDKWNKSNR